MSPMRSLIKARVAPAMFLAVCALMGLAGGGAFLTAQAAGQEPAEGKSSVPAVVKPAPGPPTKVVGKDIYGDPLPAGAVARLGTVRWRTIGEVDAIAFAPDGKTVAVAAHVADGVRLFDVASGKVIKLLATKISSINRRLAFSSDGRRLALWSQASVGVQVWDLTGKRLPQAIDLEKNSKMPIAWVGWSSDDKLLGVLLAKEKFVLRELETGRERTFKTTNEIAFWRTLAYAANVLAAPDRAGIIHVWDTTTGSERTFEPEDGPARDFALSNDGRHLALVTDAKNKGIVQIWDVASAKAMHTLTTDQKNPFKVAFTPDGKTLATVAWRDVRFWNVADGREKARASSPDSFARCLAFSPDGKTLATTENYSGVIHLWDVATGSLKPERTGHANWPASLAFSADGQRLASGGMDGILIWDIKTSKSLTRIHKREWARKGVFAADGKALFSCWTGNRLYCSDAATGQDLYSLKLEAPGQTDNSQSGLAMRLSDNGETLVAISTKNNREQLITGWDIATRKQLFARMRHASNFWSVFSPDAKVLAVPQDGPGEFPEATPGARPILLEDAATGAPLFTLPQVAGQQWPLAFSPDGRLLVINNSSKGPDALRLWDVTAAGEVMAIPTSANTRLAFTRDSRLLAMAAPDSATAQSIAIWDLRRGRQIRRIKGLGGDLSALAFSPDGRRLVAGLADTTILVWDIAPPTAMAVSLDADGAAKAWVDLAGDARKAFAARNALVSSPKVALAMLKQRLRPATSPDAARLSRLIAELGSDQFAVRQKAQKALDDMGELAKGAYERTLAEKPSLEVRQRIEGLLKKLRGPITRREKLQALQAVAVLEDIATPEARQFLETLAGGAPGARETEEAGASLRRLTARMAAAH